MNLYVEYKKERITSGFWKPSVSSVVTAVPTTLQKPEVVTETASDPLSPLLRVDKLDGVHKAREVCDRRKIPDLTRVYHCPKFYAYANWVLKAEKFSKKALYYDHPRLLIPFFAPDGRMVAFQGRDYRADSDNKYVTIKVDEDFPKVYGMDRIDFTGTVYAVEGPIDSMFIDNCAAFAGGNHASLAEAGFTRDTVVVYDNEPKSHATKKKIKRAIDDGYPVCIWPSHVKYKDVNDMVLAGLDPKSIIDSSTYRELRAEMELAAWR